MTPIPSPSYNPNKWFEKLAVPVAVGAITWLFFQKVSAAALAAGATAALFQVLDAKPKELTPNEIEWFISEDFEKKTGIDLSMITESLTQSGIPFSVVPAAACPPKNRTALSLQPESPVDLFANSGEVVWENGHVKAVIVKENGRFHLLIRPVKDVSLEQISDDDYVLLQRTIAAIPDLFQKVFGCPDYCDELVESKTAFGFEIFPALHKGSAEMDLLDKDKRNLYLLSRGRWESYSLPLDQIQALKREIPIVLSQSPNRSERPFQYKREEVNLANAQKFRITTLLKLLSAEGFPVFPVKPLPQPQQPASTLPKDSRSHETKRCFFCHNPPAHVIPAKELIFQGPETRIIVNPLPYVIDQENNRHVLVASNRHVEDCVGWTREEILDSRKTLLNLRNAWQVLFPNEEFFAWKQQGIKAGQTVPHLHFQVLTAKTSQIYQYYVYMAKEVKKPPAFIFPPNLALIQKLDQRIA